MDMPQPEKPHGDFDAHSFVRCGDFGMATLRYYRWVAHHWKHRFLIGRIKKHWSRYWDGIYNATLEQMEFYEQENLFGKMPFEIRINKGGGWIADDVMFELHFFTPDGEHHFPIWVVAFKKYEVIHSQASF